MDQNDDDRFVFRGTPEDRAEIERLLREASDTELIRLPQLDVPHRLIEKIEAIEHDCRQLGIHVPRDKYREAIK